MPDYKEMYLKLFQVTEQAINLLITAQQECEELYISCSESKVAQISPHKGDANKACVF